jgi:MFS family permease
MHGEKRTMILALGALLVGCVMSAAAPGLLLLIIGRVLQGIGIAVIPLAMSVAKATLPPERVTSGVAIVSATLGIGGGLGLPMAGILVGWWNWRAVFWVGAVLTVVALLATIVVLPDVAERAKHRFDVIGAVWLSLCLVAILLPLSKSSSWGWLQPLPLSMYVAGFAGLVGWFRYELRPDRPLVDVQLMSERSLLLVNAAGLMMGFAMFSNQYGSIALLQTPKTVDHGFGASVVVAGLVMLPGAFAMMATSPLSARISVRYSPRTALVTGALVMGAGYAARPAMIGSLVMVGISVAVVNAGIGIAYGALATVIMAYVPDDEIASANGIGSLMRASGAALSSAAVATILSTLTVGVVTASGTVQVPSLTAFNVVFVISAVASFVAALVAHSLPRSSAIGPAELMVRDESAPVGGLRVSEA